MRSPLRLSFGKACVTALALATVSSLLLAEEATPEANDRSVLGTALLPVKGAADAVARGSQSMGLKIREEVLKMREFFDVMLPGSGAEKRWVLDFEPKVGDLVRREFVRWPLELRYGFAKGWEAYGGMTPVTPNPFDSGVDARWSLGMGKLGIRHDLPTSQTWIFKQVMVGFETLTPLGEPPVDLIDHYTHLRPYVNFARPLEQLPDTTLFVSTSFDYSVKGPWRSNIPAEVTKRHIFEVAPGLLYKPGEFGYFVQYGFRHMQEPPTGWRLGHVAKIGMLWDVPLARSKKWGVPGKWQFELGYKIDDEEGDSIDHGVHARVRWKTDLFRRKWHVLTH